MNIKKKGLGIISVSLFLILGWNQLAEASENDYTVKVILSENQDPTISSYFDVTVTPGEKQNFILSIQNNSNDAQEYKIEPNTAVTNRNGVIDYSNQLGAKDATLKNSFKELISDSQKVKLAAGEKRNIEFELKVPEKEFEGIMLGGFVVTPIEQKKSEQSILHVYTHTIAAVIRQSHHSIEPELQLDSVELGQINYHNIVEATLHNSRPTIISELKIDATVTKKGHTEVLYHEKKEKLKMAPNSTLAYPIPTNEGFKAGEYTVSIVASSKENQWHFTKDFTIKKESEQQLNSKTIDTEKKSKWEYLLLGIVVLIILMIGVGQYLNKREEKTLKKERRKRT